MIAGRQGLDREMVLQISPKIGGRGSGSSFKGDQGGRRCRIFRR
jgi:hypothetical protein